MVCRSTVHFHHCFLRVVDFAAAVLEARSLREEDNPNGENDRPDECNTHRDPPGGGVASLVLVGTKVDAAGQEDTERNEKLIRGDECTTNVSRSSLSHIHGDEQRQGSNSQSSHEAAHHDLVPVLFGRDHGDISYAEDDVPEHDRVATADEICQRTSD